MIVLLLACLPCIPESFCNQGDFDVFSRHESLCLLQYQIQLFTFMLQRRHAILGESICVEDDEWVLGVLFAQSVGEDDDSREI